MDNGPTIMTARVIHLLLGATLVATATAATADTLYKCTDESGQVLYTNQKNAGTKCSVLSREQPVSTVSPPRPAARTPGDFPKVEGDVQKSRDSDRRRILQQELATEQQSLDKAKQELAAQQEIRTGDERNYQKLLDRLKPYQDSVALHERNIEALNRELANLK
jgi:hypothetical protein